MGKCVCGKELPTVPTWLSDVGVTFICNHCPSRNVQSITKVDLTAGMVNPTGDAGSQAKGAKNDRRAGFPGRGKKASTDSVKKS